MQASPCGRLVVLNWAIACISDVDWPASVSTDQLTDRFADDDWVCVPAVEHPLVPAVAYLLIPAVAYLWCLQWRIFGAGIDAHPARRPRSIAEAGWCVCVEWALERG